MICRAFVWAGLLMGSAIVLKDIVAATTYTYLMRVVATAFMVDQSLRPPSRLASRRWDGPFFAALIIAVAIAVKIELGIHTPLMSPLVL
jgi:hypothetical protein